MTILIAEDSQTQAVDLRRRLESLGHEVVVTMDGKQAWNHLCQKPERLVILDWMMPGMNGLDLCRKIRSEVKASYTYIILLTAKTHRHERLQGLSAGADDFLVKPIDQVELEIALKTAQRIIAAQEALVTRETGTRAGQSRPAPPGGTGRIDRAQESAGLPGGLAQAMRQAQEDQLPVSLLRFELDHPERLVESLAHPALQELHIKIANTLRAESRECDIPARLGDHGYALILSGLTLDWALPVADNLRGLLAERAGAGGRLTASFGVVTVDPGGSSAQILNACEYALEQARAQGGDRVTHFELTAHQTVLA